MPHVVQTKSLYWYIKCQLDDREGNPVHEVPVMQGPEEGTIACSLNLLCKRLFLGFKLVTSISLMIEMLK